MEHVAATPALREHRLYQADYLLRDYGFAADEVVFEPSGNLPLGVDPKTAWALAHPERFPVEVTHGALRGAGAGPGHRPRLGPPAGGGAGRLSLRGLADLRGLGVVARAPRAS